MNQTEEGIIVGKMDESGTLVMAVDPTTLPPDLFRILFPSGKAGRTPETVRVTMLREQCRPHQNELLPTEADGHKRSNEQPRTVPYL